MSNPTTPFNWQMPTTTDLVTDLPADFEVFGQAVATSMADLLGGTTGQILSKTSNTDMDFTWTTPNPGDITGVTAGVGISGGGTSGDVTVTNSMATAITTSGDIIQGTGSGTFARLGSGASGTFLTTNGTTLSWGTPAGGYSTYQVFTSSTTWTVPAGITKCAVYMVGGGGGGASGEIRGTSGDTPAGGGGGGGAISFDPFYTVTPAANITVTVGGGGAGGGANTSVTGGTNGLSGSVGTGSAFDGNTAGGGTNGISNGGGAGSASFAGLISGRSGSAGGGSGVAATFNTVKNLLNTAGSLGTSGTNATAGTLQGTGATSTDAGFAGGGGGGQQVTNSTTLGATAKAGVGGGGAGGGGATSASNITTTAGAGGAAAANRGGGGGGSGGAVKVGNTTTFVTSPAAGNGGSGVVIIFY